MTYFILINNQQQGPYTLDELRSRNITSATLVWREGMADWTPAWKVAELVSLFHADAADNAQTTPPPAPSEEQRERPRHLMQQSKEPQLRKELRLHKELRLRKEEPILNRQA